VVGFHGEIIWDLEKPDGTPKKLMDHSKLKNMGWSPSITLDEGIKKVYQDFQNENNSSAS
jgi:GDP-L-fucose synthase